MAKPRAFAQGELDTLCGLYAIVNAVRQAASDVKPLRGRDCSWLFGQLVQRLETNDLLHLAITKGLLRREIDELLAEVDVLLRKRFKTGLSFERPFRGRARIRVRRMADVIAAHQSARATAVLIGFHGHWSVVKTVSETGFNLCDSAGYRTLLFGRGGAGDSRNRGRAHWISPACIWLLAYTRQNGPKRVS